MGLEGLEVQKPQYTMNLACVEEKEEVTEMEKAMIMHQFAHALGMTHECSGGVGLKEDGECLFGDRCELEMLRTTLGQGILV